MDVRRYLRYHGAITWKALASAVLVVTSTSFILKWVIESTSPFVYEIHWFTTYPLVVAAFTAYFNGTWTRAGSGPGSQPEGERP